MSTSCTFILHILYSSELISLPGLSEGVFIVCVSGFYVCVGL